MAFTRYLNEELSIHEISFGNVARLEEFLRVFVALFPQYSYRTERLTEIAHNPPDQNPLFIEHQWLIDLGGEAAAMTTFKYLPQRNLGIGVHLAILPAFRDYSFGQFTRLSEVIIEETKEQIARDAQTLGHPLPPGYVIEVIEPKLVARYEEYGFMKFNIPYHEPTIAEKNKAFVHYNETQDRLEFHPAVIGLIPLQDQQIDIKNPELLDNAINAFLIDYYELNEDHWVVQHARQAITKNIIPS